MDNKYKLHGAFSWCELLTTDVPEAKRFYSKLFGWTLEAAPIPGMEYTLVKYGGEQMGPPSSLRRWAARSSWARKTFPRSDASASCKTRRGP